MGILVPPPELPAPQGAALGAAAQSAAGFGGGVKIGVYYGNTLRELATNPYTRVGRTDRRIG